MLVKVLRGVFDPPPDTIAVPWLYLAILAAAAVGAVGAVSAAAVAAMTRLHTDTALRDP